MVSLFSTFFVKTKKHPGLFFAIVLLLVALFAVLATRISFEEDITKIILQSEETERYSDFLEKFRLLDRIIFKVSFTDPAKDNDHRELSSYAFKFIETMKESEESFLIESFSSDKMKVDDKVLYDHFYENLPLYLNEKDYLFLEELDDPDKLEKILGTLYRNIVSPVGTVSASFIRKDPLGLVFRAVEKMNTLNPDGNFEVIEGNIFTKDRAHLIFFIEPSGSANESALNAALVSRMNKVIEELNQKFNNRIYAEFYGGLPVAVGNASRIKSDVALSLTLALFFVFLILIFYFKRLGAVPLIFLPAFFGGLVAIATAVFFKGTISAISLGVTSILLGITVDYSIHIISHSLKSKNIEKAVKDVSFPMVVSSLTTAAAFSCLFFLDSPVLNDLGLLGSVSILASALFSLTVLPHLISYMEKKNRKLENPVLEIGFFKIKRRILIPVIAVITFTALFFSGKTEFEDDLNKINYVSPELQQTINNIDKINDVSGKTVHLIFSGKTFDEALSARERSEDKIRNLKKQRVIDSITDISGLIYSRQLQEKKIGKWNSFWDDGRKERIKENFIEKGENYGFKKETFSQFYQLLEKEFEPSDPEKLTEFARDMFKEWSVVDQSGAMTASVVKVNEEKTEMLYGAFKNDMYATVFDRGYLIQNFIGQLRFDFEKLVRYSLFAVFLLLFFLTGRIELAVAAMIPVIVSWVWTLGIMGVAGIKFNIVNVIIVTFIFGLGIDYVVFIMRAKMEEYGYGTKNSFDSYRSSIILSCITTMTGAGALLFAVHPALRSIAFIAIAGMTSSLINALVVAPAVFDWMMLSQKKKNAPPHTFVVFIYTIIAYTGFVVMSLTISSIGFAIFTTIPFYFARKQRKYLYHAMIRYAAGSVILFAPHVSLRKNNPFKEDFKEPAVIIANHQSFLDILMMLYLQTKIVMVTKEWVNNSPVFGRLVRFADFFTVSEGYEKMVPRLRECIDDGYSIVVFPEGTRSRDGKLRRFHKGAFFLSEMLKVDIVPIVLHGTGHCIKKGEFSVRSSSLSYNILKRIKYNSEEYGKTYQEKCRNISKMYKEEYCKINENLGTVDFYRERLMKNYIYKGPDIEWYARVKIFLEKNFRFFDELVPREAKIYDLGCGLGFLTYMLSFTSENRYITGIDYDRSKIEIADNCFSKNERTVFVNGDITEFNFDNADIFIMNDVLHYLSFDNQKKLIRKCVEKLNSSGMIIVRDADSSLKEKHSNTEVTEKFSVGLGFNRAVGKLHFITKNELEEISGSLGVTVSVVKSQRSTSNTVYLLRKKGYADV